MKKTLFLSFFITLLLLIACGNSASDAAQKDNKPAPLFTPEEIAYNDSIKNLKMDYFILREKEWGKKEDIRDMEPKYNKTELVNITQEEAYLEAYKEFCKDVITYTKMFSLPKTNQYGFAKIYIELLNSEWNNIIPLVDFSDKIDKEIEIWNTLLRENVSVSEQNQYHRPIINQGKEMYAEFWLNDSVKHENQSWYRDGYAAIGFNNKKNEYPFTKKEVEQNNSIKNIPKDYIIYTTSKYSLNDNPQKIISTTQKTELTGITQEEAYLKAYELFCNEVVSSSFNMGNDMDTYSFMSDHVKIYLKTNEWIDIVPLIDFPKRKRKEKEVWNKHIKDGILPTARKFLKQPIINKGDVMYIEFDSESLKTNARM